MSDLPSHLGAREREEALRRLDTPSRQRGTSRSYPFAMLFVFCTLFLSLGACSKKKVEVKNLAVNPDSLYTARMVALNTLISDSGLIRYRMTAPELLIYERNDRNEWVFPRGLVLRPYDLKNGRQVCIRRTPLSADRSRKSGSSSVTSMSRDLMGSASRRSVSFGFVLRSASIRMIRLTSSPKARSFVAPTSMPRMISAGMRSTTTRVPLTTTRIRRPHLLHLQPHGPIR